MVSRVVKCPQCGKPVEWSAKSPFRPFCSERCKMIDFGAWAAEAYRVPAIESDDDLDTPDPRDDGADRS